MTIEDIKQLIAPDEHRELEVKKSTGELKDGMHAACAFLNTEGGWLIFGIAPTTLRIVGQQVTDNTKREIANALSGIEPFVDVRVEYIDIPNAPNDEKIIAMHFDAWVWGEVPYTYHGCPYIKVESTTKQMSREMFEERLRAARPQQFAWERQIADGYTMADMDEERIRSAVRLGVENGRINPTAIGASLESILNNFRLLKDGQVTNAAVMLFAKDTGNYPQLLLRMARFIGNDKNEFLDNKRVYGNFFDLLDAGMQFAYRHLNIRGKVVGLHREDKLEIPIEALREALVNSLCHRIYNHSSQSIGLAIYDDRIEIENPGRFPEGITAENIKQTHKSQPYNQLIAEVLYRTSWLESWGTGVKRMCEVCQAEGIPEPYYETGQGYVTIVFKRSNCGSDFGSDFGTDFGSDCDIQLTDRQRNILKFLTIDGSNTAAKFSVLFGVTKRSIEKDISHLRKNGFIKKTTKDNRSPWIVIKS